MSDALTFVFTCISRAVTWLSSWRFENIPFLMWLIAFAVIIIIIDYIFG